MTRQRWRPSPIGDLSDRTVVVTGANSGIGLEAARLLAQHGALVVLGCRDVGRGESAAADILGTAPNARLEVQWLDLADLGSVEGAAEELGGRHDRVDVLINNAGVMAIPYRQTVDGFEAQLGTNHLGHFALTGHLWPLLRASTSPRVVTVSSGAHRAGAIDFANLQSQHRYHPWRAYGQSKLANLLFTFELQRRADAAGAARGCGGAPRELVAAAAHPGYASTELQTRGPQMAGRRGAEIGMRALNRLVGQSAAAGALPTVAAAVDPDVTGGDYIGPDGFGEVRGRPTKVRASAAAHDAATAHRLWEVSEELTGVRYP